MIFTISIKKPKLGSFMKSNLSEIARAREMGATWKEISESLSAATGRKCNLVYVARLFNQLQSQVETEATQQSKGGHSYDAAPVHDEACVVENTNSADVLAKPSEAIQGAQRERFSSIAQASSTEVDATISRSQEERDREEFLQLRALRNNQAR